MKALPPISRRAYAIGGTMLILLALFAYYFLGYLPRKEEKLTAQRVRALQQIAINFQEKNNSFIKNGESIIKSRVTGFSALLSTERKILDSGKIQDRQAKANYEEIYQQLNTSIKADAINKNLTLLRYDDAQGSNELKIGVRLDMGNGLSDTVKFVTDLSGFFVPLQRSDSFEEYLIFKDKKLVYSTAFNDVVQLPERFSATDVDKDDDNPFTIIPTESIINYHLPSGLEILLASNKYKLFSTRFETGNDTQWSIFALEDANDFRDEAKMFPYLIIVYVSLGLLFVFFALPLLKLSFMSSLERLHIRDVVLTSTSFIFCCSLLIIALLIIFTYVMVDKNKVDQNLLVLSDSVEQALRKEIKEINAFLESIENHVNEEDNSIAFQLYKLKNNEDTATRLSAFADERFRDESLHLYPYFTNTYWVDADGFQRFLFSTAIRDHNRAEEINLFDRNYFKAIVREGTGWRDKELLGEPFYIESLFSRISGQRMAVVAKKSKAKKLVFNDEGKTPVFEKEAAMIGVATKLYSIIDAVLPPGYAFSFIDGTGKVLFHSDKTKNLQENYLEESGQASTLLSAMHSKGRVHADIDYYNHDYRVLIKHMKNFPWYLIVSYDKAFIQSPYLNISSFTVIGVLLIGTIGIILSTLVALFYRRTSKLQRQLFPFAWIWPYQHKGNRFFWLGCFNVLLAIVLVWYNGFNQHSIIETFASFAYGIIISYLVGFAVLANEKEGDNQSYKYRGVLFTTNIVTLLVSLFVVSLTGNYPVFLGIWITVLLVSIYFAFSHKIKTGEHVKIKNLQTAGLDKSAFLALKKKINLHVNFSDAAGPFVWMIFTYLIVTAVLPSFYLFRQMYDKERQIEKRHALYHISEDLEERNWGLRNFHHRDTINSKNGQINIYDSAKEHGNYYTTLGYAECACNDIADFSSNTLALDTLMYQIRPYFNEIFKENSGFVHSAASDTSWELKHCPTHDLVMKYHRFKYPNEEEPILLSAAMPTLFADIAPVKSLYLLDEQGNFQSKAVSNLFITLLILIIMGIFIVSLWHYLGFTVRRIFGMNLYENMDIISVDDRYLKELKIDKQTITVGENQGQTEDYLNIFIVSSPFSSTKDIIKTSNFEPISLSEIMDEDHYKKQILSKVAKLSNKIVVIEDFGYGIDNITAGWRTLEVIEKLKTNHNKIVIISKLAPVQVIEKYESLQEKEAYKDKNLHVFVSRWKDVLAEFIEMYFSYVVSSGKPRKRLPVSAGVKEMLEHEFSVHKPYFNQLWGSLSKSINYEKINKLPAHQQETFKEELLLKIRTLAQPFYYALWNACSHDEKFFLYDLANDGFANTKNTSVIIKLLEKGLIFYDESLHVMNESFRNFILNIDKAEALEMEKELNQSGTWRIYKTVIILAIISLILFFIFANQSIVKQFSALLAGLAATIPYILRLGGFFNPGSDSVKA